MWQKPVALSAITGTFVWTDRAKEYLARSATHPVSRPLPRLPSCARPRPHHAPAAVVPVVLVVDAPHPPPPQPIIAPPPPPDHPPAQIELSLSDDTEMGSENSDRHGFEPNNPNVSDDAATSPYIDDTESTDTQACDTEMTDSFTDDGDGVAQHSFVGDLKDNPIHSFNDGDNSVYSANLPVPMQGDRLDSIAHLLHQLDIGMSRRQTIHHQLLVPPTSPHNDLPPSPPPNQPLPNPPSSAPPPSHQAAALPPPPPHSANPSLFGRHVLHSSIRPSQFLLLTFCEGARSCFIRHNGRGSNGWRKVFDSGFCMDKIS